MHASQVHDSRDTPVALICFNRPSTTATIFSRIAQFAPRRLFIISDGPRSARPGEDQLCRQVRSIVTRPSWKCDLITTFSDANLGCRERVSSGISWLFDQVDEAIILEDDCLPDLSFFRFCAELLAHYREDTRIMTISGDNFQASPLASPFSYYFSHFTHLWGWATWRRAWRHYDVRMNLWPEAKHRGLLANILDGRMLQHWTRLFDMTHQRNNDTWDYQWQFASWMQNGLTVVPERNLISNIGFGSEATHTTTSSLHSNLPTLGMSFPLRHPTYMFHNRLVDAAYRAELPTLPARIRWGLRRLVRDVRGHNS